MNKEYDFSKGKRGAVVPVPAGKTRITIRLDDDLIDWFRQQVHAAGGGSYRRSSTTRCVTTPDVGPSLSRLPFGVSFARNSGEGPRRVAGRTRRDA